MKTEKDMDMSREQEARKALQSKPEPLRRLLWLLQLTQWELEDWEARRQEEAEAQHADDVLFWGRIESAEYGEDGSN